jgi:hypothetical protein
MGLRSSLPVPLVNIGLARLQFGVSTVQRWRTHVTWGFLRITDPIVHYSVIIKMGGRNSAGEELADAPGPRVGADMVTQALTMMIKVV